MGRALILINSDEARRKAAAWVAKAPWNTRITFQGPKRTLPQNALMWDRLADIATQLIWQGQRYSEDDWKDYFVHALSHGRWMPAEEGGMVPIGRGTSSLSVEEFGDLIALIEAFGSRNGVEWSEPKQAEQRKLETA